MLGIWGGALQGSGSKCAGGVFECFHNWSGHTSVSRHRSAQSPMKKGLFLIPRELATQLERQVAGSQLEGISTWVSAGRSICVSLQAATCQALEKE